MHRIIVEPACEGWLLRRPGWPAELLEDRAWAERAATSHAFEFHQRSGRPACAVVAEQANHEVLARFG